MKITNQSYNAHGNLARKEVEQASKPLGKTSLKTEQSADINERTEARFSTLGAEAKALNAAIGEAQKRGDNLESFNAQIDETFNTAPTTFNKDYLTSNANAFKNAHANLNASRIHDLLA